MSDVTFPLVDCPRHHARLSGYAVCTHVTDQGAAIAHLVEASSSRLGEALCDACHQGPPPRLAVLMLICSRCLDTIIAERGPVWRWPQGPLP